MQNLLKEIIAIPSPSFHEEEVSRHISSYLSQHGIAHRRLKNNILALNTDFRPGRKTLMLCAHIDTVEPCSGYGFDPYNPEPETAARIILQDNAGGHGGDKGTAWTATPDADGLLPGLGANDDGASVVSMIAAFRHFHNRKLPFNLMLVLSAEEERSGPDGMRLVWSSLKSGLPISETASCNHNMAGSNSGIAQCCEPGMTFPLPDYAIVGEPTEMKAAKAERGLLVIDGCAEGVSGHAARGEGVNALYIAIEDIQHLRDFKFSKISPTMGETRLNVTQINAGTAHNVIPDRCTFVVDIRPTEQYDNKEILDMLQKECKSTLAARNLTNRSSATFSGSPLLSCAERTGIETFVSPTTSDWMRIGCDAIKMGPGDSSRSHRKNEYVTVREIDGAIRTYVTFIDNFKSYF